MAFFPQREIDFRNSVDSDAYGMIVDFLCQIWGEEGHAYFLATLSKHPNLLKSDHFLLADRKTGEIASYLCLLKKTWVMNGVDIPVAQMEFVATRKEYRHHGFFRWLNNEFEKRVQNQNFLIQAIAGTPFFYRQFGYEYAAPLHGNLVVSPQLIPALSESDSEPIEIERVTREAFPEYLSFRHRMLSNVDLYRKLQVSDYDYLSYEALHRESMSFEFYMVKQGSRIVGIFHLHLNGNDLEMADLMLKNPDHLPSILRFVRKMASNLGEKVICIKPVVQGDLKLCIERLARSKFNRFDAWYIRIPSIRHFLETIKPVLENRLAESSFARFSGKIVISNYKNGYCFVFHEGKIKEINDLDFEEAQSCHFLLPPQFMVKLLMGYLSIEELQNNEPDVFVSASKNNLFNILFPKLKTYLSPFH
ncbi:MAG: GNAT family N-acetyltransferase [Candidatus Hodarchaeota archaeon]